MEFVARKTDLLRELTLLQGCAAPNRLLPILSHVFLDADAEGLKFAATDLEVGLRTACPATVTTPGVLAVPAKAFLDIVKSFPDTDVRVVANKQGATVTAAQFDGHMIALPAADFPTLPDPVTLTPITLDRAGVRELVSKVAFAMSADDQRYFLNGALLMIAPERLSLVATDGHRLALVSQPRPEPADPADQDADVVRALLSRKTLLELSRLLAQDAAGTFTYAATKEHLFFHVGERLLIAKVIDATFPDYARVIPKDQPLYLEFLREQLMTAVRRVAILADGRTHAVKLHFSKGKVTVMATSVERGEGVEPMDCAHYTGKKDLTLTFNAQYLLDGLAACGTELVTMTVKDEGSQVVIQPLAPEGFEYTYVLMPMRV